jgi:phosphate transport system substrate-binding protein
MPIEPVNDMTTRHTVPCRQRRGLLLLGLTALAGCAAPRRTVTGSPAALPAFDGRPYTPLPVAVPADARYLLRDGSIAIVGNDGMEALVQDLNALFVDAHPGFRFTLRMEGSSTGLPALTAGATLLAPMSRDLWVSDRNAFRQIHGHLPTAVRIGYNGHGPRPPAKTPPAVYVHESNPLRGLSVKQLTQVFTSGSPEGDFNTWGQLGLVDEWAIRRIHLYGLRDDGGFATGMRDGHFRGQPYTARYEPLPSREAIIRAVAADRHGMGLVGWIDASRTSKHVRVLPLSEAAGGPFYDPAYENVRRGLYPLSAPLQFYVNKIPGQPLDPLAKEYLRLALSREGQALVARQKDSDEGYVPLSAEDLQSQLALLASL